MLGKGAYGSVIKKNGYAVKQFEKTNHLIQEWSAGYYLKGSSCIVKPVSFNMKIKHWRWSSMILI